MIVVSNTSPLIALAAIERLELLQQLFVEVQIPQEVKAELEVPGEVSKSFDPPTWLKMRNLQGKSLQLGLELHLDSGEAAAIALAVETRADLLLIDERRGRSVARGMGLQVMGVAGILIAAKRRKLIPWVRPCLDDLLSRAGFRLSHRLVQEILREAGEISPVSGS